MSRITTGLPQPANAINGVETTNSELVKTYYNVLAAGGNFVVARTLGQKLVVVSVDNTVKEYDNQVSAAFETNVVVRNGSVFFTSKQGDQLFINAVSLTDNSEITKQYLTTDKGFPSVGYNAVTNQILIYKHFISEGTAGHGYIYVFNPSNFTSRRVFDGQVADISTLIHIGFDQDTGEYYRSFKTTTYSEIAKLTILSVDAYKKEQPSGKTIVQDTNSDDLYYPTIANGRVYVYNEAMTTISAWGLSTVNSQVLLPITVDTRENLFGANTKPYYERMQVDSSTNLLHDTRVFFSYNTSTFAIENRRYPICVNGNRNTDYEVNTTDRQPVRVFSPDSTRAFYRVNNENFVYELNSKNSCPFFEPEVIAYTNIVDGIVAFDNHKPQEMFGEVTSEAIVGTPVFINEALTITVDLDTLVVNGTRHSSLSNNWVFGELYNYAQYEYDNKYFIRTPESFEVFAPGRTSIPADRVNDDVINSFIFNNKFFVRFRNILSILDFTDNTVEDIRINFARPDKVKLFPDIYTNNLLLFDKDKPNVLRQYNYEPNSQDYTVESTYSQLSTVITTDFPSLIDTSAASTNWELAVITPKLKVYMDHTNSVWQSIYEDIIATNSGTLTPRSLLEPAGTMTYNGYLLFSRNTQEVFKVNRSNIIPLNQVEEFKMENVDQSLPVITSTDSKLGVSIDSNGFMRWLTSGAGKTPANTSYIVDFKRTGARYPEVEPDLNTLRFTFLNSIKGDVVMTLVVEEDDIFEGNYKSDFPIKLTRQAFGNNRAVSATEAKQILKVFSLECVVDETKLAYFEALFYNQWYSSATDQRWEILFDDLIYPEENPRRPTIGDTKFVRHSVAITNYSWEWFSKDEYKVNLDFEEIRLCL